MAQQRANDKKNIAIVTGKAIPRIDAPLKVSGRAKYTSDFHLDRMCYAVPVGATIAKGKIKKLDAAEAKSTPGVLAVYSHGNIGPLYRPGPNDKLVSRIDEMRPPFEDEVIRYYGQYVAVVVAETFEIAKEAAAKIKISYAAEKPNVDKDLKAQDLKKTESQRGNARDAFAKAAVKVEHTYVTPVETHNPIEMHASVAEWDGDKVTLYETTQSIVNHRSVMSQILGVPLENVRIISLFLGSGFGGKLWPWNHSAIAAASARNLRRPVKLVIDRTQMFTNVGHRPRTQQLVRLSADPQGHLQSLEHSYVTQVDMLGEYKENCGEASASLYNVPHLTVDSAVARRNQGSPTSMRGPGAVPGLYAIESAMDELAIALKMDPVELRILNDTQVDQSSGAKYSSRHLSECLKLGAERFGWAKRNPQVGAMKNGDEVLGWGVAVASWPARRIDAEVLFEFHNSGKVRISSATSDLGTGMYTVLAQITQEETGLPFEKIEVQIGDSRLPPGPLAGGSMATASIIPAAIESIRDAVSRLKKAAGTSPESPLHGQKDEDLKFEKGEIKTVKAGKSIHFAELLKKTNTAMMTGRGASKGNFDDKDKNGPATKSFGAQFVEVSWQPSIARLRVKRVVTVIDGGRIINLQPAKNQIEGAIIMGIGMGLFEQTEYDSRDGNPANKSLADYVMTVHADCPEIDVTFLDYPDKAVNEYGARGVGEIGLAGVAAAICNAVYHASGVRVRELPVRIEDLLKAPV